MIEPEVTVVIPYHASREANGMLQRAIASVSNQTIHCELVIVKDVNREGAAVTRQRGLEQVTTPWTAFLDSDDELDSNHIEKLLTCAWETDADYVYPWFRVTGGSDPFPMIFGRPWDNAAPHQTTITVLVRTEIAKQVGFSQSGEDWFFTLGCMNAGAKIVHLPERTWTWYHHGKNSSGMPGRGDAV